MNACVEIDSEIDADNLYEKICQIGMTIFGRNMNETFLFVVRHCEPIDGINVVLCQTEKELISKWLQLILKNGDIKNFYCTKYTRRGLYRRCQKVSTKIDYIKILNVAFIRKCQIIQFSNNDIYGYRL